MTNAAKLDLDAPTAAITMNAVVEKSKECPVITGFQGHEGDFVIMTADQYADMLDAAQTVKKLDVLNDPMLQSIANSDED